MKENIKQYLILMRLNKPIGIYLLAFPILWALWIAAQGVPDWHVFIVFILGTIIMRSAGCIINDYADRDFDAHVARTQHRPLATQKINTKNALLLFICLCISAFCLVLTLNHLTIYLSFVAVLLACIYPFMKRHTHLPQLFLGMAFGWGIPMAFAAITNSVPMVGWIIFCLAVIWAIIYDTMYAMADKLDDLKIGIKSTAILFGNYDRLIIGILQVIMLLGLIGVGIYLNFKLYYYINLLFAAGFMLYQHYLIKDRVPQKCFKAFLNNAWFGLFVFIGIVLNYSF